MSLQTITFECRIDGRIVPQVLEVTCSAGFDQINAEATIWAPARPSWADERMEVTIWAKNSATGQGQIFGGEVTGFDWTYAPTKVGVVCGDLLARARDAWGGDEEEYSGQTSAAVVRNALEKNAIPSSMASIEGDDWTIGTINPLILSSGDDPYGTLIAPLDDLEGYKTYSLSSGVIVRRRVTGAAGGAAALTFEKGVTILSSPRHSRTALGIVNKVIITGVDYEGLVIGGPGIGEASSPNPYVSNVSGYTTERIQSNLIEDDATALLFAERRVADKNRRPEQLIFSIPLDPRVQPGMTIAVNHADLESSGQPLFCQNVAHAISGSGATTTIRATGGSIAAPVLQPPVAVFTIQAYPEAIDTGSGIDSIVVIICDGSGSFDMDGTIASYAWTITPDAGTATPDTGASAVMRSVVSGATAIDVTLTVTDNDGLTGELLLTKDITPGSLPVEDLYLAFGVASCSVDGEQTWRDATPLSGNAICLMPIAPEWQAWGTDTGHIYATFDKLATDLVDLGTPHGAVGCTAVWIHELDATRLWAGFSDGAVYRAVVDLTAFTATWSAAGTIPDSPIIELRESYGTFDELRATAGSGYYYSTDGGNSWALQHTFDTARRMAAGFDHNLASGLNDSAPLYDEDGTPPTVPGGVTHVRGLSFGWRVDELYGADDAANLYLGAGPSYDLSLHADATAAQVNHMIRSGNIDRVVYLAEGDGTGDNGFQKWIPDTAAPFFIRRTGTDAGLMIGYGALHAPPRLNELLLLPYGASGASDKIWRFVPGTGWAGITPPYASGYWQWIASGPLAPDSWLLLGNDGISGNPAYYAVAGGLMKTQSTTYSPLWLTTDAGATWTEIDLPSPVADAGSSANTAIAKVEWSRSDPTAWFCARQNSAQTTSLWRGSGATAASPVTDTATVSYLAIVPGLDGDVYFPPSAGAFNPDLGVYVTSGDSWIVPSGSAIGSDDSHNVYWADYEPLTRRVIMTTLGLSVWQSGDYRASQPVEISGAEGSVALVGGVAFLGDRIGVGKIADPFGAGALSDVAFIGSQIGTIRADRQTHTTAAARVLGGPGPNSVVAYDGVSWTTFAGPAGVDNTELANAIEVIVRGLL